MAGSDSYGEAAETVRRWFEVPVLVAALLVVPVIVIEARSSSEVWLRAASITNWLIWLVFLAEFVVVVSIAKARRRYLVRSWLDVVVIVVSFPLLPSVLASTRLLRLTRLARALRVLRMLRLAAIVTRGVTAARSVFGSHGLGYVVALILLIAFGIGGTFALVEGTSVADGFWWALVTVTTVGYGDVFPVTTGGRIAASILMLVGIGLIAVVTASIAARFVGDEEALDMRAEIDTLHRRLDRLEALLSGALAPPVLQGPHDANDTDG